MQGPEAHAICIYLKDFKQIAQFAYQARVFANQDMVLQNNLGHDVDSSVIEPIDVSTCNVCKANVCKACFVHEPCTVSQWFIQDADARQGSTRKGCPRTQRCPFLLVREARCMHGQSNAKCATASLVLWRYTYTSRILGSFFHAANQPPHRFLTFDAIV